LIFVRSLISPALVTLSLLSYAVYRRA